jgi:hypothetical protein
MSLGYSLDGNKILKQVFSFSRFYIKYFIQNLPLRNILCDKLKIVVTFTRHEAAIHKACGQGKIRAGKDYWKLVLLKWNKSNCEVFAKECALFDALGNGEIALDTFITIIRKMSEFIVCSLCRARISSWWFFCTIFCVHIINVFRTNERPC